jgi:uncharacterized coiled-coil DUF342 family protein
MLEESEAEIQKLLNSNNQEKEILLQFESEYTRLSEELKEYHEEARKLRNENGSLKKHIAQLESELRERNEKLEYAKIHEDNL